MFLRLVRSFVLCCLLASPSAADLIGLPEAIIVDNSAGGAELDDIVTQDLLISFDGEYSGSQILTDLTTGSIYQNTLNVPSERPPNPNLSDPAVPFDTFTAVGSAQAGGPFGEPNQVGGAVDLGGVDTFTWTENQLNAAWGPSGSQSIVNQTQFLTARISLTSDANGSFQYLASVDDQIQIFPGTIRNGRMTVVPEPSVWPILAVALGFLGAIGRFRAAGSARKSFPGRE